MVCKLPSTRQLKESPETQAGSVRVSLRSVPGNVRPKAKCEEKARSTLRRAHTGTCAQGRPPSAQHETPDGKARPARKPRGHPNAPARGPRAPTCDVPRAQWPRPEAGLQQSQGLSATSAPNSSLLQGSKAAAAPGRGPVCAWPCPSCGPRASMSRQTAPRGPAQDLRAGRSAPPDSEVGGGAFPLLHSQTLGSFWAVLSAG